jgi:cytochrome c
MKKVMIALAVAGAMTAPMIAQAEGLDGKALYEAKCQSCHGAEGGAPIMATYPKLKGQGETYLIQSFDSYKKGERTSANAMIMKGMAMLVTDDESKAIAKYLSGL